MKQKRLYQTIGFVFILGLTLILTKSVIAASPTQWMKAKVMWVVKPDACRYDILYREKGALRWQHALQNIPATQQVGVVWRDVEIRFLKPGVAYDWQAYYASNCSTKKSMPVTNVEPLKTVLQ